MAFGLALLGCFGQDIRAVEGIGVDTADLSLARFAPMEEAETAAVADAVAHTIHEFFDHQSLEDESSHNHPVLVEEGEHTRNDLNLDQTDSELIVPKRGLELGEKRNRLGLYMYPRAGETGHLLNRLFGVAMLELHTDTEVEDCETDSELVKAVRRSRLESQLAAVVLWHHNILVLAVLQIARRLLAGSADCKHSAGQAAAHIYA